MFWANMTYRARVESVIHIDERAAVPVLVSLTRSAVKLSTSPAGTANDATVLSDAPPQYDFVAVASMTATPEASCIVTLAAPDVSNANWLITHLVGSICVPLKSSVRRTVT